MMAELNEKQFQKIAAGVEKGAKFSQPLFQGLVDKVSVPMKEPHLDWAADADWAHLQQEPLRARWLLRIAALSLVLLLVWAAVGKVDEVTRGEARVVPTSQVQIVQSVDGGVLEEIMVREGQHVEAGQLLGRVDNTRFTSNLGESRATQVAMEAKALRLRALSQGVPFNPSAKLMKEAPDVVAHERRLYESRRSELDAQLAVAQNVLAQRQQELNEVRARREQAERGLELAQKELSTTRPLVSTGAVSEVEVIRLEREVARLRGDREQATAQISRVQASIAEAQRRIDEVRLTARNQMSAELSETMGKISSSSEGGKVLEDKVLKADLKSPVRGTVKRLLVPTVGAVLQPGKEVFEVVPTDDALILEVRIPPKDIAFLRPKQEALVKFTAYDFAIYGGLKADVETIGADSVVDDKGNAFYIVRVRTRQAKLGDNLPIIPGMVAQVDIMTGQKTVLTYLLKPVLRAKANALSER